MHRIDGFGAVENKPDAKPEGQKKGFFDDGSPALGREATQVTADWLNAVQEEIEAVITAGGIELSKENNGQMVEAIAQLIAASGLSIATFEEVIAGIVNNKAVVPSTLKSALEKFENSLADVATTGSYNDLENKPTIPPSPEAYITDSWRAFDGSKWYRKWSDGFIEQAGVIPQNISGQIQTVTLHENFTTNKYFVSLEQERVTPVTYYINAGLIHNSRTTENFQIQSNSTTQYKDVLWYACGY